MTNETRATRPAFFIASDYVTERLGGDLQNLVSGFESRHGLYINKRAQSRNKGNIIGSRRGVRSSRQPVKLEIAGSNPVGTATLQGGRVGRRCTVNAVTCGFESHPCSLGGAWLLLR